jgi:hypothetical protein
MAMVSARIRTEANTATVLSELSGVTHMPVTEDWPPNERSMSRSSSSMVSVRFPISQFRIAITRSRRSARL